MLKRDVYKFMKDREWPITYIADRLNISHQAVSRWPEKVPELAAIKLDRLTKGKLRYKQVDYPGRRKIG